MKCSACRERLGAYLEGDLSNGSKLAVAGHVASCAACSEFALTLRAVDTRLACMTSIEPRSGFTPAVMNRIASLPAPRAARLTQLWWIVGYLAAVWAFVGVGVATRTLAWRTGLAAMSTFFGKAGVSLETLLRIAGHFHLAGVAAVGIGIEVSLLVVLAFVGRKYFSRFERTFLGAGS